MNADIEALAAIVEALDCDRDRLGRLKTSFGQAERLRQLAVKYQVGGAVDTMHQAVLVGRAVLALHDVSEFEVQQ